MQIHRTVTSLRLALEGDVLGGDALEGDRRGERGIGFVPTMGALHAGHLSLVHHARRANDVVVLSIFVNPLQFGPNEDFHRYPRPFDADVEMAQAAGVTHLFAPSVEEMYPAGGLATSVRVCGLTEVLEGAHRPGHFDGMATVVTKLFAIVGQCHAYFGEKDWQQLQVVHRLAADLSLPVEVVGCPILREPDGLAMSSRNRYLSPEQRKAALVLPRALGRGRELFEGGERKVDVVRAAMLAMLAQEPLVEPDYVEVVDKALRRPTYLHEDVRLLITARLGSTRLLDNSGVTQQQEVGV